MADRTNVLAERGPDTLVREIEQARKNLAQTIDAIAERVSPASAARRAADRARERAQRLDPRLIGAGAAFAVGLAAYLVWRRRKG
jgi:type VI protein secretion system component VasF